MISSRSAPVTAVAKFFNLLGLVYVTLPVRIAIAGFLALRRRWWHLAAFVAAIVLSEILIGTLKGDLRPGPAARIAGGHQRRVVPFRALDRRHRHRGRRGHRAGPARPARGSAWGAAAVVFSVLMALSRAYLGAHWLSDALAGVLLGTSCALLAALAVGELQRRWHRAAGRPVGRDPPSPGHRPCRRTGDEQPSGRGPGGSPPPPRPPALPSSRYRHPGDVIRLISAGLLLGRRVRRLGGRVPVAPRPGRSRTGRPRTRPARSLTGLVQVACLAAAVVVVAATLRSRRFRLLAGLATGALAAAGPRPGSWPCSAAERPAALTANHGPRLLAGQHRVPRPRRCSPPRSAVIVAAAPWLSRPWRRAAWLTLLLAAAARLLAGTVLPMELILALAAGVTAGAAVLVAFGVPDRRMGPAGIAAALRGAGLPVESVRPAEVESKGSRPFAAVAADGRRLFIKALGSDQRDADLLYRAYRAVRLRNVGDTRPAASLLHAVEHQALVGIDGRTGRGVRTRSRPGRPGRTTPCCSSWPWADGSSLDQLPAGQISDDLLARLWAEVDKLHRAGIAHRSLRAANVMADPAGRPRSSTSASPSSPPRRGRWTWTWPNCWPRWPRWPARTGPSPPRSVSSAPDGWRRRCRCCSRWPCPPPPAARSRGTTACSPGPAPRPPPPAAQEAPELARVQRVRPRTLLAIAALTGSVLLSCCPSWPRSAAAGTPCRRRTGSGCPWSSPSRR